MTACAMTIGMVPMALALERGSEMQAPLGRAVIGGLVMSTVATLLVVPSIFAIVIGRKTAHSPSISPEDPGSPHYDPEAFASDGEVRRQGPPRDGPVRSVSPASPASKPSHIPANGTLGHRTRRASREGRYPFARRFLMHRSLRAHLFRIVRSPAAAGSCSGSWPPSSRRGAATSPKPTTRAPRSPRP